MVVRLSVAFACGSFGPEAKGAVPYLIEALKDEDEGIRSQVAKALGNIGPGLDQVGPAANYAHFSPFSKWVMSLGMLLGRLELMTVFVFFMPSLWRS